MSTDTKPPMWSYEGNEAHEAKVEASRDGLVCCGCSALASDHFIVGETKATAMVVTMTVTVSIDLVARDRIGGYAKAGPYGLDTYDMSKVESNVYAANHVESKWIEPIE